MSVRRIVPLPDFVNFSLIQKYKKVKIHRTVSSLLFSE